MKLNLNFLFFIIGMSMVWHLTHNWWVMLWAFVAAIHITVTNSHET